MGEAWSKDAQDERFKRGPGRGVDNSLELATDLLVRSHGTQIRSSATPTLATVSDLSGL